MSCSTCCCAADCRPRLVSFTLVWVFPSSYMHLPLHVSPTISRFLCFEIVSLFRLFHACRHLRFRLQRLSFFITHASLLRPRLSHRFLLALHPRCHLCTEGHMVGIFVAPHVPMLSTNRAELFRSVSVLLGLRMLAALVNEKNRHSSFSSSRLS